jgi:hypothetical protein
MSIQDRIEVRFLMGVTALFLGVIGCKPEEELPSDEYVFAEDEASAYAQIDRHAMPAVNVVLIASKDEYNMVGPGATADYVDEMTATVTALHDALDDDLTAAGLTPCATDVCMSQAAPLVVPDTLKIDTSMDAGFPNGRQLTDPVIDVTLAVILLDLSMGGQTATTLAGVPINPTANDVAFETAFPYVAPAH